MKKILFLIDSLKAIGGAEQMFIDQANYFAEKGIEVHAAGVLAGRSNHFSINLSKKVHFTELNFRSTFDIREYFKLAKYLRKNDIKTVYSFLDFSNVVARLSKLFYPNARMVIIEPGNPLRRNNATLFFEGVLNFLVFKIFAISDDVRDKLVLKFPFHKKKIISVRNGVPAMLSDKEIEEKLSRPKGEFFEILHVGNMKTENKGHEGIIRVISKIHKDRKDIKARLFLAGGGAMRSELEKLVAAEGLKDSVVFLGAVLHEEVEKYYFNADVFIFNSRSEGGAAVIMEAASAALPVVTSDFNSANEVVKDNETGFIVRRDDIGEFAAQIEKLYDDSALRVRMGRNARKLYTERFTFEVWTDFFI